VARRQAILRILEGQWAQRTQARTHSILRTCRLIALRTRIQTWADAVLVAQRTRVWRHAILRAEVRLRWRHAKRHTIAAKWPVLARVLLRRGICNSVSVSADLLGLESGLPVRGLLRVIGGRLRSGRVVVEVVHNYCCRVELDGSLCCERCIIFHSVHRYNNLYIT
jgi:hypothetical protein